MSSQLAALNQWVEEVARLTQADTIHWCDGSAAEFDLLVARMLTSGELHALNPETHPNCYLHRSHPSDVARVEHVTFVCTTDRSDAGPNNHWMSPADAHAKMNALFDGCMKGRTLYVVPYCMGPLDSPLSRCGVEITDRAYVVANMRIMTRIGTGSLARIEREGVEHAAAGRTGPSFVKGLHSIGELDPERRFIMHFPEELSIQSYGSGYGGNALLGKKCHALRIASYQAMREGWLAEHMLILGVQNPQGETRYLAAAFPSACGKTNLAMLIPPEAYLAEGWKVWTVGDDICWMQPGADGRLYAINPEAGFFGVAPGTSAKTNPNALAMLDHDAIFTNVAVDAEQRPWWEGLPGEPVTDWQGREFDSANGPAAHPNSRFTVSAAQCASASPAMNEPHGVPIDAIIFGGRRASLVPLVLETESWTHGVLAGAAMASETTAAATGAVGVVRRDPMAMKPFCGYHFGDYFAHWLSFEKPGVKLPKVFHVNWFRKGDDGKFLWPGFGDNMRVLEWILGRCDDSAAAVETPIGRIPAKGALRQDALAISDTQLRALLHIDNDAWRDEFHDIGAFLQELGDRVPVALEVERQRVLARLKR